MESNENTNLELPNLETTKNNYWISSWDLQILNEANIVRLFRFKKCFYCEKWRRQFTILKNREWCDDCEYELESERRNCIENDIDNDIE